MGMQSTPHASALTVWNKCIVVSCALFVAFWDCVFESRLHHPCPRITYQCLYAYVFHVWQRACYG